MENSNPLRLCVDHATPAPLGYAGEPQVAVHTPTDGGNVPDIVGVWSVGTEDEGSAGSAIFSFDSLDERSAPLAVTQCGGGSAPRAGDPWVSIGPDGTIYATAMDVAHVFVADSRDGGQSWSTPVSIPNSGPSDKDSVTADPTRPGVAYVVWSRAAIGGMFSETTNGGATWTAGRLLKGARVVGGYSLDDQIVVNRRSDALIDVFIVERHIHHRVCDRAKHHRRCRSVLGPDRFTIKSLVSTNGGKTWSGPYTIARRHGETRMPIDDTQFPQAAIDPKAGRLYVVWADGGVSGKEATVMIASSPDGRHWDKPRRIPTPQGLAAAIPQVAVAGDTVGVTYYTLPFNARLGQSIPLGYWLSTSSDGTHFGPPLRIGGPTDLASVPEETVKDHFLGDYEGLGASGDTFYPFFAFPTGDPANPQAIYLATVPVAARARSSHAVLTTRRVWPNPPAVLPTPVTR